MNAESSGVLASQSQLRSIERREWFLWVSAVLIIFLLTWAVLTFTYRSLNTNASAFYVFQLQQAVRGLVGLILLFALYTFQLQLQLHRLRRQLAENLALQQSGD